MPKNNQKAETESVVNKKVNQIKSGIEDKVDISYINSDTKEGNKHEIDNSKSAITKPTRINNNSNKTNYIEILTIEPNNTSKSNITTHNILEVLKNLMPSLNNSITKDLHSITIIEKNQNKNHSYTETKNISTIIVKYCDKDNMTKNETSSDEAKNPDEDVKALSSPNESSTNDDYDLDDDTDYEEVYEDKISNNRSSENSKDVLEAAEYGLQKMHELYGVLEPKLYSMGKLVLSITITNGKEILCGILLLKRAMTTAVEFKLHAIFRNNMRVTLWVFYAKKITISRISEVIFLLFLTDHGLDLFCNQFINQKTTLATFYPGKMHAS